MITSRFRDSCSPPLTPRPTPTPPPGAHGHGRALALTPPRTPFSVLYIHHTSGKQAHTDARTPPSAARSEALSTIIISSDSSMDPRRSLAVIAAAVMVAAAGVGVGGDFAADRNECSEKLAGLATCLTYVQERATATSPTPDCCSGLKTVLQTSRKCLCVLVRDRDDPNLGLKIDVSKALGLPAVCNAPANISDCPRLLNLPPNSKDAQVFEQYVKQTEAAHGAASATGVAAGANATPKAGAAKNGAAAVGLGPVTLVRWLGVGGARAAVLSAAAPLVVPFFLLLIG